MHLFNVVTVFIVLTLVGVEFSVSAFMNPAASRLESEAQFTILGRLALVLGKVMPIWYPLCNVLFAVETWLTWNTSGRPVLLVADAFWLLATVASLIFLVPLNTRIANGVPDWQHLHRLWDRRHRVRVVALSIAAILLTYVVAR